MVKYKEIVNEIRGYGGFNYQSYLFDKKNSGYKKDYRSWKISFVKNYFKVSRSVAENVVDNL